MVRHESDLIEPRDEAFYSAYKKALRENSDITHYEAVRMALESPQPRMWIAFYGVYRTLLRVVHHSRNAPKTKARSCLESEVARKYYKLSKLRAFRGASLFFIASFIISEPSVGFYISEVYAKKIIIRMRKKHQKAWRKSF